MATTTRIMPIEISTSVPNVSVAMTDMGYTLTYQVLEKGEKIMPMIAKQPDYDEVGEVYEGNNDNDESLNDEIIEMVVRRMEHGAKKYGEHIMVSDKRNFIEEALEEALDMIVYLTASLLRLKKSGGR
jgi:hypothetical protein|tara:strand:- start:1460 stop:1843 length:384 start_codon:yes stop_codon:yes gene_type:complete